MISNQHTIIEGEQLPFGAKKVFKASQNIMGQGGDLEQSITFSGK